MAEAQEARRKALVAVALSVEMCVFVSGLPSFWSDHAEITDAGTRPTFIPKQHLIRYVKTVVAPLRPFMASDG